MSESEPRSNQALNAPERAVLEAFLDDNRAGLAATLTGLTDEQARRRLVPSLTTPFGLVKHAAFVEQVLFQLTLAGRTRAEIGIPETVDESFVLAARDTVESVLAHFHEAVEESRRIAAAYSLDDQAHHRRLGPLSLRWVYVHLIEELARHAGHGDILREQIEAADPAEARPARPM